MKKYYIAALSVLVVLIILTIPDPRHAWISIAYSLILAVIGLMRLSVYGKRKHLVYILMAALSGLFGYVLIYLLNIMVYNNEVDAVFPGTLVTLWGVISVFGVCATLMQIREVYHEKDVEKKMKIRR
jgi:TctA family transporter